MTETYSCGLAEVFAAYVFIGCAWVVVRVLQLIDQFIP